MGIFPKFFRSDGKSRAPSDDFWYQPATRETAAGVSVDEREAMKYLAVASCVRLVAGDIARLPLIVYQRTAGGGKNRVVSHPLYDILHNVPNRDTSSFNFRETLQGHLMLWGNAYAEIVRSPAGEILELIQFIDPAHVEVSRREADGRIIYTYKDSKQNTKIKDSTGIFHVPGYGFDGILGQSCITAARQAIGLGLAAEKFGSNYFGQGTHPAGILSMEGTLGDDENRRKYLTSLKEGYAGLGKSHNIMVLEHGLKYSPLTMPLDDAQFLETRNFQKTEICGFYHVPPHKIGIHGQNSNYNNLEQENQSYVDSCLLHWAARWEFTILRLLFTKEERKKGLFAEFLFDGMLRGDSVARAEYYNKMLSAGAMSPNDIRAKENQNPIEGGDKYFIPANYVTLENAGKLPVKAEPAPDPAAK